MRALLSIRALIGWVGIWGLGWVCIWGLDVVLKIVWIATILPSNLPILGRSKEVLCLPFGAVQWPEMVDFVGVSYKIHPWVALFANDPSLALTIVPFWIALPKSRVSLFVKLEWPMGVVFEGRIRLCLTLLVRHGCSGEISQSLDYCWSHLEKGYQSQVFWFLQWCLEVLVEGAWSKGFVTDLPWVTDLTNEWCMFPCPQSWSTFGVWEKTSFIDPTVLSVGVSHVGRFHLTYTPVRFRVVYW